MTLRAGHAGIIVAARSLGASGWRIITQHLPPACGGFLMVQGCLLLPAFILAEATLSHVGLGFPEHVPTWGTLLIEAASVTALTRFPWMLAPAAAIFVVVATTNVVFRPDYGRRGCATFAGRFTFSSRGPSMSFRRATIR